MYVSPFAHYSAVLGTVDLGGREAIVSRSNYRCSVDVVAESGSRRCGIGIVTCIICHHYSLVAEEASIVFKSIKIDMMLVVLATYEILFGMPTCIYFRS